MQNKQKKKAEEPSIYPKMTLIVAKKARAPPCKHSNMQVASSELAYLNGDVAFHNSVGVRILNIRPGDYFVFYKQEYPKDYEYLKLNMVIQGHMDIIEKSEIQRIDPKTFTSEAYNYLLKM